MSFEFLSASRHVWDLLGRPMPMPTMPIVKWQRPRRYFLVGAAAHLGSFHSSASRRFFFLSCPPLPSRYG